MNYHLECAISMKARMSAKLKQFHLHNDDDDDDDGYDVKRKCFLY